MAITNKRIYSPKPEAKSESPQLSKAAHSQSQKNSSEGKKTTPKSDATGTPKVTPKAEPKGKKKVENAPLPEEQDLSPVSYPRAKDKYTQSFTNVKEIRHGLIFTEDGNVVKILEVLPINFGEKNDASRDSIADSFGQMLKQFPKSGQFKIMDSRANIDGFIRKVRAATYYEKNPVFQARIDDYIENTRSLQNKNSVKKRFFYIYSYEGDVEGRKSDVLEDIWDEMTSVQQLVTASLATLGNFVLNDYGDDDNDFQREILYSFFNPRSFMEEGSLTRTRSVRNAAISLSQMGIEKIPPMSDHIAPRGIRFTKWNSVVMDGMYHTYLILRDTSFPRLCKVGWVTEKLLDTSAGIDIDIKYRQAPKEASMAIIERSSIIRKGMAINYTGDHVKQEEFMEEASNADYILHCLKEQDEDFMDVSIQITLRAKSYKELMNMKKMYQKRLGTSAYYFDDSFLITQHCLNNAIPLNMYVPEIFNQNKRNFTNSSFSSLYCFSTFDMYDPEGMCIGTTTKQPSTLFSLNTFNKALFPNPHMFIAGTTGAGKSYTEMMLASRMRMSGYRTLFILPLKGHEYKDNVESLDGSFISLMPGGQACINIMEIRPEGMMNGQSDDTDDEFIVDQATSLLAKKTTSILTFLSLLANVEFDYAVESMLNVIITGIYNSIGITDDNNSIWADKQNGVLKTMPILSDLLHEVKKYPELGKIAALLGAWVNGNCANMNGQTNVDLTNRCLAFDINEDYIGARFLPAFMYIAFDAAYAICKSNIDERCVLILDEIWKLLAIDSCAAEIFKCIKILRAYNAMCLSATQDIEDCALNRYGRSILTLSSVKLFLKASREEVGQLMQSVSLSPQNVLEIQSLPVGHGFVCFNDERILISMKSSLWEEELYTPGLQKKAEIRQRMIEMAASEP